MDGECGALAQRDGDAHIAAFGIAALHAKPNRCARQPVVHRTGGIAHGAQPVIAGEHPLGLGKARPCAQQRAQRIPVPKGEQAGFLAAEREARGPGEQRLVGLLHRLHAAPIRGECGGDGVVDDRLQLIGAVLPAGAGEQRFKRCGQLARAHRAHAAAGVRACQKGVGGDAAAGRAVRLVHAGQPRFRGGQVFARAGQNAAQRAGAQPLAQVCARCRAQQVMGVAGVILLAQRVEDILLAERARNGRAVGEGV